MGFFNKPSKRKLLNEEIDRKIAESHAMLLAAATLTADAAQEVTLKIRSRLDEARQQFSLASHMMRDGLVICDGDGTVKSINRVASELLGYKLAIGKSIANIVENIDHKDVWKSLTQSGVILADGSRVPVRTDRMTRIDGETVIIMFNTNTNNVLFGVENKDVLQALLFVSNNQIIGINQQASKTLKRHNSLILGQTIQNIFSDQNLIGLNNAWCSKTMACGENGLEFDVLITAMPIEWENGTKVSLLSVTREEIEPEGFIRCSGDDYVMTSTIRPDQFAICRFDLDYNVIDRNSVWDVLYPKTRLTRVVNIKNIMSTGEATASIIHFTSLTKSQQVRVARVETTTNSHFRITEWRDSVILSDLGEIVGYERVGRLIDLETRLLSTTEFPK